MRLSDKLGRLSTTGLGPVPVALPQPVPGATRRGPEAITRTVVPGTQARGGVTLQCAARAAPAALAALALDVGLLGVDPSRLLLVDTETTGLSGGAGTLPFLIGMAWFEDGHLVCEQRFVEAPGEERPHLEAVAARVATAGLLVTYNGKSFDWPLLRTRFVLNRLPVPRPPPHLDVLHCARRVFKRRLGGMRLAELETSVLSHARTDDIPGWAIPAAYFDFLAGGDARPMHQVLSHNADDLLSLAALMGELVRRFESTGALDDADDLLGLATVAQRAGHVERAQALALAAFERAPAPLPRAEAAALLARLATRQGRPEEAAAHLVTALESGGLPARLAAHLHLSLSKLCEHQLRDAPRALLHARLASMAEEPGDSTRRLMRLSRRTGDVDGVQAPASVGARRVRVTALDG